METQYYQHTCKCGCGGQIEVKKYHKYRNVPLYISGHNVKKNHPMGNIKARKKVSESLSGRNLTENHRQSISESNKGRVVWNKGKKNIYSEETLQKMSKSHIGLQIKEKNGMWNNGSSFEEYGIEFNKQFKQQILERDNYMCQCPDCEHKSNTLDAHHIDYDKQNNSPENIITLCRSCHSKTNFNRKFYIEFYQNIMMGKLMECFL